MAIIKRALISVSNKEGLFPFVRELSHFKIEILSTGGTAKLLRDNKIPVREVSDYTGQPEILDGRVKTLHPKIHGGILAIRSDKNHLEELKKSGIEPIDLVIVNLYPFEETIALTRPSTSLGAPSPAEGRGKKEVSLQEAIENIDIGGPTLLRAAAKNWQEVTVLCDPNDYSRLIQELKERKGEISRETNFELAKKVFALTAHYDAAISNYLTGEREGKLPQSLTLQFQKIQELRYGENPHQRGGLYTDHSAQLPRQLHGKELSFNNILDLNAAIELVGEFSEPACVIIKHTNPCGVALGERAFVQARECDPQSAFGGIIALNRPVNASIAAEISKDFYEGVVAPGYESGALEILKGKKNIRLMELNGLGEVDSESIGPIYDLKKIAGGLLVQDRDRIPYDSRQSKVVTKRAPTEEERKGLEFAWRVVKQVKSNAIVIATSDRTFGIGAGQMSRVDAVKLAISKMGSPLPLAGEGSGVRVLASDAFFPFRDSVDEAARAGVTAIIQPGGSIKDEESIAAANEHQIAMLFTGVRHFKH